MRAAHGAAAHVSSILREKVASVKAGASFTSVSATETVAEADMPPPSVAVTSSEKALCCGLSKLSSCSWQHVPAMSGPPLATTTESALGCVGCGEATRKLVRAPKRPWLLPPLMAKVWLNQGT